MYLSSLLINVGDNPDRPRPGRLWLRNLYHVHQRLCMAFPSASRKSDDADFLKPFKPEDFGNAQVHVSREPNAGFLFRIDPQPGGRVVILVQSAVKPDWDYAFHNAGYLLAASPEVKDYNPSFVKGQRLRFRLVANPTKKIDTIKKEERQNCTEEELKGKEGRHGRRVPVRGDQLIDWLARKAEVSGFSIYKDSTTVQPGYVYFKKPERPQEDEKQDGQKDKREGKGNRLRSVRYEGILEVSDADKFLNTIICGIGPGKAFGFGLLTVAPAHPSYPVEAK